MLVQADTANGVYEVKSLEDFNAPEVVSEEFFYRSLAGLKDGEEMAADISAAMAEKIASEYGIKTL